MKPEQIGLFNRDLLMWFHKNKRDLPWRKTKNPYYIWISEVMLQQTQVDTVIPYYKKFIERFPTPERLAETPEQEVLKSWEGLGYYSRARNLQKGVREVVEKYGGHPPENKKELLTIHGIGPYTAGALLSIAYDRPEPAVDGNAMRVMSRIFLIDDDIAKTGTRKKFENLIGGLITETDPSAFNQSLMDLGAMVCRPKNPDCNACPVQKYCGACEEGVQNEYPIKSKAKKPHAEDYVVLLIFDRERRLLIEQRPLSGLLAGMWQFPMIRSDVSTGNIQSEVKKMFGRPLELTKVPFSYSHRFSHLIWNLTLYLGQADLEDAGKRRRWVAFSRLEDYPFPVPHQKIIEWAKKTIE